MATWKKLRFLFWLIIAALGVLLLGFEPRLLPLYFGLIATGLYFWFFIIPINKH